MSLTEKINSDLKEAMKAKDKDKLMALRAIKSALLLANTAQGASDDVSESEELKILQKQLKQRKDAAATFKEQGRDDLYEKEMLEAGFIQAYLPEMLEGEELEKAVKNIVDELGATNMQDMGRVMGAASKQLAGKAEGKAISDVVKKLLA